MSLRSAVSNGVSSVTAFLSPNGWPRGKGSGKGGRERFPQLLQQRFYHPCLIWCAPPSRLILMQQASAVDVAAP
jgi:hypothetical protein